jgi:hypothetical protein
MIEPLGRIELREATVAKTFLQRGREQRRDEDVQLELVEQRGLQVRRFGETPRGGIGIRDREDVVRVFLDLHFERDRIARRVLDVPSQVCMISVRRDLVRPLGECTRGRKVSQAARLRPVRLRAESGGHVVGSEDEIDEAPEAIAARRARNALASDRDQPLER